MEKVYFTLEQANALIPYLTETLGQIKAVRSEIMQLVRHIESQGINMQGLFSRSDLTEKELQYRRRLDDLGDQINGLVFEIQEKGVVVKDIDQGLVDFFARIEGSDAFLCWKLGETEIQFWHSLVEGFRGRKSLFRRSILEEVTKVH